MADGQGRTTKNVCFTSSDAKNVSVRQVQPAFYRKCEITCCVVRTSKYNTLQAKQQRSNRFFEVRF